jgi:competence protein ComEC
MRKIISITVIGLLLLTVIFVFWEREKLSDGKLHIVFCDVGQGDAIYIKTPKGNDILIDGGPDDKVLGCLSSHMPFWDRDLEMVVLSHPQADHLTGLIPVVSRYTLRYFVTSPVGNTSLGYKKLIDLIANNGVRVKNVYTGEVIDFGDGTVFKIVWPEEKWAKRNLDLVSVGKKEFLSADGSGAVLGVTNLSGELNDFSTMILVQMREFDALLTGDGDEKIQDVVLADNGFTKIEVLKVPHHGSKTAMTDKFLQTISSSLAVISVGKGNKYGHPAKETIEKIQTVGIEIKRTDKDGEIEVVSDGEKWWER